LPATPRLGGHGCGFVGLAGLGLRLLGMGRDDITMAMTLRPLDARLGAAIRYQALHTVRRPLHRRVVGPK
jgi:hypothetical protein